MSTHAMYTTLHRSTLGLLSAATLTTLALGQCPEQSIQGADTTISDAFGRSLDSTAARLIVGASLDDDQGNNSGSAYVFRTEVNGLVEEAKLVPTNISADDHFGHAVAMTPLGALVSAPNGDGFDSGSGVIVTFARNGTNWSQVTKLDPQEGDAGDEFGFSIAIDGNRAVVGAPGAETTPGGPDGGAAYIFEFGGGNGWQLVTKLIPNDINGAPRYGHSVALDGDRIVVGAPNDNDGGNNCGAAYVFDKSGGTWNLNVKLIQVDFENQAVLGWAVDVDGDEVMVGAPTATGNGVRSGATYVFSDASGSWTQEAKLFDIFGAFVDRFGYDVSMKNGQAMIGAPFSEQGGLTVGSAYECNRDGGTWEISFPVASPTAGTTEGRFGVAVAVEGNARAVGDSFFGQNVVHAFDLNNTDCNFNGIPDDCEIAAGMVADLNENNVPDVCDGCGTGSGCTSGPNSTGSAATMSSTGSVSVAANDLVLQASNVPNQPGLFFYGPIDAFVTFGNGIRCVGAPFQRLSPTVATNNVITTGLDITAPPTPAGQITPGSTWYFQCWFRDPAAGGANFDLSDGLKATFCP